MNRQHVSPRIAEETERVLARRDWSNENAMIHTGVGRSTVAQMRKGIPPSPELLSEWAERIGEDAADWLRWAGYDRLVTRLVRHRDDPPMVHEEREVYDQDADEVKGWYQGLPNEDRALVRSMVQRLRDQAAQPSPQDDEVA